MKKNLTILLMLISIFITNANAQIDPYKQPESPSAKSPDKPAPKPTNQGEDNSTLNQQPSTRNVTPTDQPDYNTLVDGAFKLVEILNDHWTPKFAYLKFQVGLGYNSLPLITNANASFSSQTNVGNFLDGYVGLKLGLLNNKGVSVDLNPYYIYSYSGIVTGSGGSLNSYGGNLSLYISPKSTSKLRFVLEAGYKKMAGNYSNEASATSSTKTEAVSGELDYSTTHAGAGVMFHLINEEDEVETYFKPMIRFVKPSFGTTDTKPVMVAGLEIYIRSAVLLTAEYSKNYLIGGTTDYKYSFDKSNQNYFNIKLIRNGKLF